MAGYQENLGALQGLGVQIVAASVDSQQETETLVSELGLEFPLGHGLVVPDDAARIGAYWDPARRIIQPSGFLLRDGEIFQLVYASGSQGRLPAEGVVGLVRFLTEREGEDRKRQAATKGDGERR